MSRRGIDDLLSTPRAAEELMVSPDQFRWLARHAGIAPAGWYRNPHYLSGPQCPLWSRDDVTALRGAAEKMLEAAQRRRAAAKERQAARLNAFNQRYRAWRDALPEVAEALFNLNRYAKHETCRREHREEIYDLKNRLIELLYRFGFCTGAHEHIVPGRTGVCRRCDGDGRKWGNEDEEDDNVCRRCDGTGTYKPGDRVYIVFRFHIGKHQYTWHQPRELVRWPVTLTAAGEQADLEPEAKPVALPRRRFSHAKALIRYILDHAEKATLADGLRA